MSISRFTEEELTPRPDSLEEKIIRAKIAKLESDYENTVVWNHRYTLASKVTLLNEILFEISGARINNILNEK